MLFKHERAFFASIAATFVIASAFVMPSASNAAGNVNVVNVAELQTAVSTATEDITITLDPSFPAALTSLVTLTQSTPFNVTIDGGGKTLTPFAGQRHIQINASSGSIALKNLVFAQAAGDVSAKGIGINQTGAAAVTLDGLDFVDLKAGTAFAGTPAVSAGGAGTGLLTIQNSTFSGGTATFGAALRLTRNSPSQQTVLNNVTFDSNTGLAGSGYSGGAVFFEAGSNGTVTVNDSAFIKNQLLNGGTQPRGGAIAMHNSNIRLYVNRSYFYQNRVESGTSANADGGALSAFNSSSGTNGSIVVRDSTFKENSAQDDAAAIFIEGRSPNQSDTFAARIEVYNSTFVGNVSGDAGGSDTGGAIQASLRAAVLVDHSTFVGDTKGGGRGGIDIGAHLGVDGQGVQYPQGSITNSIFTRNKSVDTGYITCTGNVGCDGASRVPVASEDTLISEVFGSSSPTEAVNRSSRVAGDLRSGNTSYPLTTVAIAPPFPGNQFTAYNTALQPTTVVNDQRDIPFGTEADAGSVAMDYVRFDAATNGGTWNGIASTFPSAGTSYLQDATASSGWYEVGDPDSPVTLPLTAPTPPVNMQFSGWYTQATGGTAVTAPLAQGQTVYAQFLPLAVTHTVTFDSDGGTSIAPITNVSDGTPVVRPSDPTRAGFTFVGWKLNGSTYDFSAPVTADITLVAAWEPVVSIVHKVTFDSAGGTAVASVTNIPDGSLVAEPKDPTRKDFTFQGWTLNDRLYDFTTPITEDITLVAKWKANSGGTIKTTTGGAKSSLVRTGMDDMELLASGAAGALMVCGGALLMMHLVRRRTSHQG